MSKLFLGIDGGGTKTAFAICDEKGNILIKDVSSTIHVKQASPEKIREVIFETTERMLDSLGKNKEDLTYLFAGVPACGEFSEIPLVFEPIFTDLIGEDKYAYRNDSVAGWAGSQAGKPGVNMVLGTGAIAYGMDYKGNEARSSGWGPYCGDQGSGYWLGREAIKLFGRQSDGRAERSHLYELVNEKYDLENDVDFISIILDLEDNRTEIAKLSKLISKAAELGDEEAKKVIYEASKEVIDCMNAVIKKLDFEDDETIYISYSGGVFNLGEILTKPIEDELTKDKRIKKLDSVLDPTSGACLMALKFSGEKITEEIIENLK